MSIPVIYANTQYIAGKHLFKTIPEGISTTLNSLTDVPTYNVMTLVGGNVGIGTTNPTASLHVLPNSTTTGVIINQVGSGSILDIQDGGVSKVIINGNGNIGIGTATPREYLDVQGGNAIISGSIGIATTSPLVPLHVVGQTYHSTNVGIGTATPRQYLDVQGGNAIVSGSIGIGTTNPTSVLHVVGASLLNGTITTNNNSINAGTGTVTAATFSGTATQVSSTLTRGSYLTGNNFTGAAATTWAVDATTTATASKVVARDASAYMFASGVGIGTATARQYLDVQGGNAIVSGNVGIGTTNPTQKLYVVGQIYATDNITAFSDSRFKTNVKKIENVMDKIKQINGYTFNRIDSDKSYMGVIAQEVQQVFPQIIESQGDTLSVAYGNLVAPLIEVVKELNERIEVLESKLKDL